MRGVSGRYLLIILLRQRLGSSPGKFRHYFHLLQYWFPTINVPDTLIYSKNNYLINLSEEREAAVYLVSKDVQTSL